VTGESLAGLLEMYMATMFRPGGVIDDISDLPTQKEMLVRIAGERSMGAALSAYEDAMSGMALPVSDVEMEQAHLEALAKATVCFDSGVVLDGHERDEWLKKLEDEVAHWEPRMDYIGDPPRRVRIQELHGGLYADLNRKNVEASSAACDGERERILGPVESKARSDPPGFKSLSEFDSAIEVVMAEYETSTVAVGPCRERSRHALEAAARTLESNVKRKLLEAQITSIVQHEVKAGLGDVESKTEARVSQVENESKEKYEELQGRLKNSEEQTQALSTRLGSTESDMASFVNRLHGMDERVVKLQEDMQKTLNNLRTQVTSDPLSLICKCRLIRYPCFTGHLSSRGRKCRIQGSSQQTTSPPILC